MIYKKLTSQIIILSTVKWLITTVNIIHLIITKHKNTFSYNLFASVLKLSLFIQTEKEINSEILIKKWQIRLPNRRKKMLKKRRVVLF
jgi:hypothetical protein